MENDSSLYEKARRDEFRFVFDPRECFFDGFVVIGRTEPRGIENSGRYGMNVVANSIQLNCNRHSRPFVVVFLSIVSLPPKETE